MSGSGKKVEGNIDQAAGKVKEVAGDLMDDEELENEGKIQQIHGDATEAEGKIREDAK